MKVVLAYLLIGSYGLLLWQFRLGRTRKQESKDGPSPVLNVKGRSDNELQKYVGIWVLLSFAMPLPARTVAPGDRLAQFIQSPSPIREMLVEYHWYYRAARKTNTHWMGICWQTNGYVFRLSNQKTHVFDLFATNRDALITIRAGNSYSVVSYEKVLGVHSEHVVGLGNGGTRDLVSPKIRGQETLAAHALMVGFPLPVGALSLSNNALLGRDEVSGCPVSGRIDSDQDDRIRSIDVAYVREHPQRGSEQVDRAVIRYRYGNDAQPDWFPHEIVREGVFDGQPIAVCRLVIHKLEFGTVPISEFYADRFLSGSPLGSVTTSNRVSSVVLNGVARQVLDPSDPRVLAHAANPGRTWFVRVSLGAAALGALALGITFWVKRRRFYL